MANEMITKLKTLFLAQEVTDGTADAPVADDAIRCWDIDVDENLDVNDREAQGIPGTLNPIPGAHDAGLTFKTDLRPNGSNNTSEIDELLTACFGKVLAGDLDTTISGTSGGTGATGTPWDVTSGAAATVSEMAMLETGTADTYEVAGPIKVVDTGATPDDVTVALAAVNGAYATNGKKVKGMRTHQILCPPASNNSLTGDVYYTGRADGTDRRDRIVGLRGDFSWDSPKSGAIPVFSFKLRGQSISRVTNGTRPSPTYDSANPKAAVATIYRVDGTYTNMFDVSLELGAVLARKASQNATSGTYGQIHAAYRPKGKFKVHPAYSSISYFTDWEAGTAHSLLFQVGNTLNGTYAFYIPRAVFKKVVQPSDSGLECWEVDWTAGETNVADPTSATLDAAMYLGVG